MPPDVRRRRALGALATLPVLLGGCAGSTLLDAPGGAVLAESPSYRAGDRWTYRVDQLWRAAPDYDETVEIVAVAPDGIDVRVISRGGSIDFDRRERWIAPGLVVQGSLLDVETRRFREPLQRLRFPLAAGATWNQWVDQVNDTLQTAGPINRYVRVQGMERVSTPAGAFDAVRMTVIMRLDDETPFRYPTECSHIAWYAPQVRGFVREERRAQYREKGSGHDTFAWIPVQNEVALLTSFEPGR
ncbi:MAG TPA: hypothetical protein VFX05_10735 [Casimicrobiaceae bacterium]|nr:hypothetical protein [Casimicrobiaceae bacterium]